MRFINDAVDGMAVDDLDGVHPDLLQRYHSVSGSPVDRAAYQTGAEHPSDEEDNAISSDDGSGDDSEQDTLQRTISSHIHSNIHHHPVKLPRSWCPFTDPTHTHLLDAALGDLQSSSLIPAGYGVRESEWDEGAYPEVEVIKFGRKKEITVSLPSVIWKPRAIAWVHAVYVMQTLTEQIYNG
jgi:hypothetical protein